MTGIVFREPGIEEARSFRAWKSKKPLPDKADLSLKSMDSAIAEMISQRRGIMIGCQRLCIPKHNDLLLRHRSTGQPNFSRASAIGAPFLQIGQSPPLKASYGPSEWAFLVLIRI
ncbi:hypothetical protein [Azospirillum endophyticum]